MNILFFRYFIYYHIYIYNNIVDIYIYIHTCSIYTVFTYIYIYIYIYKHTYIIYNYASFIHNFLVCWVVCLCLWVATGITKSASSGLFVPDTWPFFLAQAAVQKLRILQGRIVNL